MSNEMKDWLMENEAEENVENEGFVIDDVQKAMWAIGKIKEKRKERDFYVDACKREIERLKGEIDKAEEQCDRDCNYFTFKLNEYMDRDDVPSKTTKTQMTLKLPNGKIVRKLAKEEICDHDGNSGAKLKGNCELMDFVDPNFLKTTVELDWANFKKELVVNDGVVMTKDGEVVDCLMVREVPPTVDVKIDDEDELA